MTQQARTWWLLRNGDKLGPYTTHELREMAERGQLGSHDHIWQEGLGAPVAAGTLHSRPGPTPPRSEFTAAPVMKEKPRPAPGSRWRYFLIALALAVLLDGAARGLMEDEDYFSTCLAALFIIAPLGIGQRGEGKTLEGGLGALYGLSLFLIGIAIAVGSQFDWDRQAGGSRLQAADLTSLAGVLVLPDGAAVVFNNRNNSLSRLDLASRRIEEINDGEFPRSRWFPGLRREVLMLAISAGPAGSVLVLTRGSSWGTLALYRLVPDGHNREIAEFPDHAGRIVLASDGSGTSYVGGDGDDMLRIDGDGQISRGAFLSTSGNTAAPGAALHPHALAVDGATLYLGTPDGLYRATFVGNDSLPPAGSGPAAALYSGPVDAVAVDSLHRVDFCSRSTLYQYDTRQDRLTTLQAGDPDDRRDPGCNLLAVSKTDSIYVLGHHNMRTISAGGTVTRLSD